MMRCSVQPKDRIFVKGYGFLSFAKNIGENISKDLNGKYSQKLLDHAKQSATDAHKTTSKRAIEKTAEATGHLVGNKTADRIMKVSKLHHKIIQNLLQMNMIKKHLQKDMYLQKKDR